MKQEHFDGLLQSLDEARRHAGGETVPGLQVHVRKIDRNEIAAVRIEVVQAKQAGGGVVGV